MNKKLIALAVAAASISGFASAAEVYSSDSATLSVGGRAEVRTRLNDGDLKDDSRTRINVAGTSKVSEGLTAIGFTEFEYYSKTNNDNSVLNARHIYAGFQGDFGRLTFGKQDGSLGQITDFSDIYNVSGGANASKINVADRTTQNLLYTNNFNGLNIRANYKFDESQDNVTAKNQGAGFSLSGVYEIAGFAFGAGYAQQDTAAKDNDQVIVGISYSGFDNLYLGLTYNDTNTEALAVEGGIEFAGKYTMGKTHFGLGYFTADKVAGVNADDILTLEVGHKFSRNLRGAIASDVNLDESKGTVVSAQLRYDF